MKSPEPFFTDMEKTIINFMLKQERTGIVKAIMKRKTMAGGIPMSDFKLYYRAITIKQHDTDTQTDA